jgi:hypothetical protein
MTLKYLLFLIVIATSCNYENKKSNIEFSIKSIPEKNWETYEGKWLTQDGIIRLELFLSTSSNNIDSYYKLHESFESEKSASSTTSKGKFTFYPLTNKEFGIRLHNLGMYSKGIHFRVKESKYMDISEEMFFITRGVNELIPTDENFKPITLDKKYTLHKRLDYLTVEGYITFDNDTAQYYERNTMQYWKIAELGEFDDLKSTYKKMTKEKYEGLYLKALAYSVTDNSSPTEKSLVIKRVKAIGNDPEGTYD